MPRRSLAYVVAVAALMALMPSAEASWLRPTSTVSGTVTISWHETVTVNASRRVTTSGEVVYRVLRRLAGPDEAQSWVPGAIPSWTDDTSRLFGFFLVSQVSVPRYTSVTDYVCENGAAAQATTTVASIVQPNALLMVNEPRLNLLRGTGTADVDLAFDERVYASGEVSLHTTGTDCSGRTEEGWAPGPVDTTETAAVSHLLRSDITVAVVDAYQEFSGQVTAGGGLRLDLTRTLPDLGDRPESETRGGTYDLDLVFGGPPHSMSAFCDIPRQRKMSQAENLDQARALLRRAGFPKAPYGGERVSTVRKGRFFLYWGGSSSVCGHRLGTRSSPALYRSAGAGR